LGLTLPNLLRAEATATVGQRAAKAKNVIFYWCQGGPPHQDMWDLKPEAPAEVRGEFKGIDTVLPGYQVCELMPELAKRVDKLSIVRGVNHHIPDHNPGSMFMLGSGNAPNPTTFHPSWSAVCKKEFPETPGLPTAVAIPADPGEGPGAGFLGAAYTSFAVRMRQGRDLLQGNASALDATAFRDLCVQFDASGGQIDFSQLPQGAAPLAAVCTSPRS